MSLAPQAIPGRRRSSSVIAYLKDPGPSHHLNHLREPSSDAVPVPVPLPLPDIPRPRKRTKTKAVTPRSDQSNYGPRALQWVQRPAQSFSILAAVIGAYCFFDIFAPSAWPNPFADFLFVAYALPHDPADPAGFVRCQKGVKDLLFLPFYIVAFSFLRQAVTQYVVRPFGARIGISKGKMGRFMEQGYAVVYFGASSAAGLYVMRQQDSWFYRTEQFWLAYPHWAMPRVVKTYYLTQFAYWLQQALVMIAGLEKPREDYIELIIHHVITLWLVGASYLANLTQIGIAIFVSMDIPDLLLAVSKCINYAGLENTGNVSFVIFMFTWGYLRHYENIRILHSVWTEFELVPAVARTWDPSQGYFLPPWMRYQIFAPILALQLVIAFWSFLILRIVVRMFAGKAASDVREENEGGTETDGAVSEVEHAPIPPPRRTSPVAKRELRKRK